jgi:hypothetical protein
VPAQPLTIITVNATAPASDLFFLFTIIIYPANSLSLRERVGERG